ncbi:MAG: hypothetical protein NZ561_01425, partial [Phycisphaerae bacterium]|nr:hypothetical protein [Phycisphaerae bacterium]
SGIIEGTARDSDLDEIARLSDAMNMTSICGLGQVVSNPITCVIRKWKDDVQAHLKRAVSAESGRTVAQWNESGQMSGSAAAGAGLGGV